jgi:hypothetical protein
MAPAEVHRYAVRVLRAMTYHKTNSAIGIMERVEAFHGLEGCRAVEAEFHRLRETGLQGYEREAGVTGIVPPPAPDTFGPDSPLLRARQAAAERKAGRFVPVAFTPEENQQAPETVGLRVGDHDHKYGTMKVSADGAIGIEWDDDALIRLVANWIRREQERPSRDGRRFNGRRWPQYVSTYDPYDLWY